jgi:hypothetical protein
MEQTVIIQCVLVEPLRDQRMPFMNTIGVHKTKEPAHVCHKNS